MINKIIESEFLKNYRCIGFDMQDNASKISDLLDFNEKLINYSLIELKEKFKEKELQYICMACFNSPICYEFETKKFLSFKVQECNKYETAFDGDINKLIYKIENLKEYEALIIYLLAKQVDNKTLKLVLV